jgi:hypothetical protein
LATARELRFMSTNDSPRTSISPLVWSNHISCWATRGRKLIVPLSRSRDHQGIAQPRSARSSFREGLMEAKPPHQEMLEIAGMARHDLPSTSPLTQPRSPGSSRKIRRRIAMPPSPRPA